jgi:hypothetical protein
LCGSTSNISVACRAAILWRRRNDHPSFSSDPADNIIQAKSPVNAADPGTASPAHYDENLAAADIRLGDEEMRELTAM